MNALKVVLLSATFVAFSFAADPNFDGKTLHEMFGVAGNASEEELIGAIEQGLFAARPGANSFIGASHYGVLRWGAELLSTPDGRSDYAEFLSIDAQLRPRDTDFPTLVQQKAFFALMSVAPRSESGRFGAEFIRGHYTASPPYTTSAAPLAATRGFPVRCAQLLRLLAIGTAGALATKAGEYVWNEGVKPQFERVVQEASKPSPVSAAPPSAPSSTVATAPPPGLPTPAKQPPPPVAEWEPPAPTLPEEAAKLRGQRFGQRR